MVDYLSSLFNVKLFRFATSFKKPKYGVLFWAVTIIDCPEEMKDVRLSVGSNGASMWWLNGGAIHISNLQVLDPKSGKPTRIGRKQNAAGKLVRFAKKSGEEIK